MVTAKINIDLLPLLTAQLQPPALPLLLLLLSLVLLSVVLSVLRPPFALSVVIQQRIGTDSASGRSSSGVSLCVHLYLSFVINECNY